MCVPTVGQPLLINQFMRGESTSLLDASASTLATLAVSVLRTLVAIRLFGREQVLFGRGG